MSVEYRVGDARRLLAELAPGSVDLLVTSPPYLSLRSYLPADHPDKHLEIGSESTPAAFIATLLELTAEFRRVLAPHGSIAIELGDTYSGSGGAGGDYGTMAPGSKPLREGQPKFDGSAIAMRRTRNANRETVGWPLERCLTMVPELYRVALAYGIHPLTGEPSPAGRWRVRNVIVHGRPNPPVGSLGDKYRPACSYWAVACVNRRWFDQDAVRTEAIDQRVRRTNGVKQIAGDPAEVMTANFAQRVPSNAAGAPPLDWFEDECDQFESDLWTIPTAPYKGAHYATFAPELVRRFIVSMCPPRVCQECGKPSKRITTPTAAYASRHNAGRDFLGSTHDRGQGKSAPAPPYLGSDPARKGASFETLGWTDCGHNAWRPGLVLDPFGGSGTTGMVASGNGRDALLFDLDARGLDLARERIGLYLEEQDRPHPDREPTAEQGVLL